MAVAVAVVVGRTPRQMTVASVAITRTRTASHGVIPTVEWFDQRGGFSFQERRASRVRSRRLSPTIRESLVYPRHAGRMAAKRKSSGKTQPENERHRRVASFRLDVDTIAAVDALAAASGVTRAHVLARLLEAALDRPDVLEAATAA